MMDSIITKIKTWNEKRQLNIRRKKLSKKILTKLADNVGLIIIIPIIFLLVVVTWGRDHLEISVIVAIATCIIVAVQTTVLAMQADISKEQKEIAKYRYNPIIVVNSEEELSEGATKSGYVSKVIIKNWGDAPALNLDYHIYKNKQLEERNSTRLDPGDKKVIYGGQINSEDFGKMDLHIDIEYQNVFGEYKTLSFYKPPDVKQFFMDS